jgi:hypothetical protein
MEDNLKYAAIEEILKEHNVKAVWEDLPVPEIDGALNLNYKGHTQRFYVEIKKELREYQLPGIFKLKKEFDPIMIITAKLYPKIRDALTEQGIGYIEMNGNIYIETENILLKIEGKQNQHMKPEKRGRAFTKAGLKTLFLFLTNENDLNDTYREIAKNAGIALGNVNRILEGLIEEGFVLRINEKDLKLINKEQLLQKWIAAYTEKLKPAIKIGNFRFNNPNDFMDWKNIMLTNTRTQWGGEPAGNIYTKYLQPEYLTMYANLNKADLIKDFRFIPDPDGNVIVYEKFWMEKEPYKNVVHPIIAYADLLATGKTRCIETAQRIYEKYIENTVQ